MSQARQPLMRYVLRIYWIRKLFIAAYNRSNKNPMLQPQNNEDLNLDKNAVVSEVRELGFSNPFQLNSKFVDDLIADCKTNPCVPHGDHNLSYRIDVDNPVNPDERFIQYFFKDSINWQSVKNIIYNSTVLEIAKDYLGNDPVPQNVSIWWSFAKPESVKSNVYNFHYDIDNLKFIKLFTYLTPVDESNGPHIIYPRTHKVKTLLQKRYRSVPDDKVTFVLGKEEPVVMVGGKGTSFFEDTFSYHKGLNPIRPRLIFQVEYSLTPHKLG